MDEPDRLAVLLHCLEERPFREVGEALGLGEDAARKRVNRALERLAEFFRRQGFAVPTITAGAGLFMGASAPAALLGSVASAGMASVSTGTLLMTSTAMKAGLATVLAVAVATPILVQQATILRTRPFSPRLAWACSTACRRGFPASANCRDRGVVW